MKVIQESLQQADKVVLSDEHLWNETEWDEERFQMLRMQMEKMGATLKVIVYLRRQDLLGKRRVAAFLFRILRTKKICIFSNALCRKIKPD